MDLNYFAKRIQSVASGSNRICVRDGTTLQLRQYGRGDVSCLLVHGFAEGSYVWTPCMRSLGNTFPSIAVDLRGHGDSDWDKLHNYNVQAHTADVNDLLNLMGNQRRILIGHSMGAHILMRVTMLRPDLVAALVLVDFGPHLSAQAGQRVRELLKDSLRHYTSVAEYAQRLMHLRPLIPPELVEYVALSSLRPIDGGFQLKVDPALLDSAEALGTADESQLWQIMRDIACPVLIVRGAGSAMLTRQVAERMMKTLRHGRLATVPLAGHGVMMDNPREFNEIVGKFCAEHMMKSNSLVLYR